MPIKHSLYRGLSLAHRAFGKPAGGPGSRVLMYHSVGGEVPGNPYGISMPVKLFRAQMARLAARGGWRFSGFEKPSQARRDLALTFDDGFKDNLTAAAPVLQELGLPMTVFVTAGHVRTPGALYLSKSELLELARLPGVGVGAHGDKHVPLDALSDGELAAELRDSKAYLEDVLGRPVTALSYPHGRVDRRVRDAAQKAGYRLGGTSRYGLNGAGRDPLLLCRTEITAFDTVEDLELKVDGHWDWFARRHADPAL